MTSISDLAEVTRDDDDDSDAEFSPSKLETRGVAEQLAHVLVADAIPASLNRRLGKSVPVCVVITVPGVDWCSPIALALGSRWPNARIIARDGSSRSEDKPARGNDQVALTLAQGRPVFGVSHAPQRYLPSALMSAADAYLDIVGPTQRQMRGILKYCTRPPIPRYIPDAPASGLSFHEIAAAIRGGQSAKQAIANLIRARATKSTITPDDDTPRLESLVGLGAAKEWGLALASGLTEWRRNNVAWSTLSSSAVFYGPPGTGKSLAARALAKSCDAALVSTSVGAWFATSDGNLDGVIKAAQAAFDEARARIPSILFIDELDAIPNRAALSPRGKDWWTPVVNFLLTLFDIVVTSRDGTILLGATNHINQLDAALIRPGRFDKIIEILPPTADEIAVIIRQHLGTDLPAADLAMIATLGGEATGAVAAGWVRQARAAANAAGRPIAVGDLIAAVAPTERRNPTDVWRIAVHEAGHAVAHVSVGHVLGSVSIIETSGAEGRTEAQLGTRCLTADGLDEMVVSGLAGRAAEIEIVGSPSAGAEGDLAEATALLTAAIASFGLGPSLLHVSPSSDVADALRLDAKLRCEVSERLATLHARAIACIRQRRPQVEALARALVVRRALSGREASQIIAGGASAGPSLMRNP